MLNLIAIKLLKKYSCYNRDINEVVSLIAKAVKARNKAAIMVTHDERMLTDCDRVYRIEDGILSEEI